MYAHPVWGCYSALVVPAKPLGNLPLRVFQRYFARMADACKECPGAVANELYSNHLITGETVDKVHFSSGLTPNDKATALLRAVEPKLTDREGHKTLRKLCGLLAKHPTMKKLSSQIMKEYGKLYTHTYMNFLNMLRLIPFFALFECLRTCKGLTFCGF